MSSFVLSRDIMVTTFYNVHWMVLIKCVPWHCGLGGDDSLRWESRLSRGEWCEWCKERGTKKRREWGRIRDEWTEWCIEGWESLEGGHI